MEKKVYRLTGVENHAEFVTLHNRESLAKFGERSSLEFLEALAELHVRYCELQNKNHAICVHSFKHRTLGLKFPLLSAEFTANRWGLFGYRFGASVTLWNSTKYVERWQG